MKNKPRNKKDETSLLVWGVPRILKDRFKTKCLRNRTSMRRAIVELIRDYTRGVI